MDLDLTNSVGIGFEIEALSDDLDDIFARLHRAACAKLGPLAPDEVFRATGYRYEAVVGVFAILRAHAEARGLSLDYDFIMRSLGIEVGIVAVLQSGAQLGKMTFRFA